MDKDKAKSISNSLKSNAGKKWDESIQLKLEHLKNEGDALHNLQPLVFFCNTTKKSDYFIWLAFSNEYSIN